MRYERRATSHGFTLVELLVALMVMSIVLGAVATLAFAMGAANDATDDTSEKQAQVRYATLRLSEMIRHSKLICGTTADDIVLWKADDNPENDRMDIFELAYIQRGSGRNYIKILEFTNCPGWLESGFRTFPKQVDIVDDAWFVNWLISQCGKTYTTVLPQCSNVEFDFEVSPPWSRIASISFDIDENGVAHHYQISAALRSSVENMLNSAGDGLISDDD